MSTLRGVPVLERPQGRPVVVETPQFATKPAPERRKRKAGQLSLWNGNTLFTMGGVHNP